MLRITAIFISGMGRMIVPVAVALLPKCGFCLMAYFNLFGLMGLSIPVIKYYRWLMPLLFAAMAIHLFISYVKARHTGDYRLFMLQLTGTIFILLSRTVLVWNSLMWAGVLIIFVTSIIQMRQSGKTCKRTIRYDFDKVSC